jgi:hypothetical protein
MPNSKVKYAAPKKATKIEPKKKVQKVYGIDSSILDSIAEQTFAELEESYIEPA